MKKYINEEIFKIKYSLQTYNWLVESQAYEDKGIKYGGKLYIPLSIEKKDDNIFIYITKK